MAGEWLNALMQSPNAGETFIKSYQHAQDRKEQQAIRQQQMQEHQQDRQMQMDDRQAAERTRQLKDARERLGMTARLLDHATDPVSYQQARQAAAGLPGFDVSAIPEQFDPNWVAEKKMQAQVLAGQVEQELMAVAPGTTVIDKRTGQKVFTNPRGPHYIPVQPGGKLVLEPGTGGEGMQDTGGGPTAGTVEDGYRFKGGNPADPSAWEPVNGGPAGNQPGGFPY